MAQSSVVRGIQMLAAFVFIFLTRTTYANSDPRLEWDSTPDPNIAGYRVYSGEMSRNYTHFVDVGLATSVPLTNLSAGVTHYLAVTAYDTNQVESPWSDEVWFTVPIDGVTSGLVSFTLMSFPDVTIIQFNGRAGQQCRIVASSDLSHWETIYTENLSQNGLVTYDAAGSAAFPTRFYRVIATPPMYGAPLPFKLTSSPSMTTIEFAGTYGQQCHILASFDLRSWQEIYSATLTGSHPVTYRTAGSSAYPMRFYRVLATSP
jgi:hypothetical protein